MMFEGRPWTFERLLFLGLAVLLVWLPIPLGSNRPWAVAIMELATFALLAGWVIGWAIGRVKSPVAITHAWPAWLTLALWLALQIVESGWTTVSIDPNASEVALLKSLMYAGIFFLVVALCNKRSRVSRLAHAIVYGALAYSVYAVMLHLSGTITDFFGIEIRHGDSASGPFVNRNHLAGYLEMALAIGIGLLITGLSDRSADTWKKFLRLTLEWILSPKMVLRLTLCVLVIALTTTHSRMGNAAFFASLLIAGAVGIALSRYATRNTVLLLASLVAIDLFIVGSWFGVEKLAKRIGETTVQDVEVREEPPKYALDLIGDYPVFGAGPGSFYLAFPPYRKETISAFFDHAHNDYVEITAESGVLGLLILATFVILSLGAALKAQWQRRDPLMRGISFASIMGVTAILIHSWVDFNLQIPANAALFMVLLAFGWISLYLDRREGAARTRAEESEP